MPNPEFSSASQAPDPQYVREISGRRFVLYAGLLDLNLALNPHLSSEHFSTI